MHHPLNKIPNIRGDVFFYRYSEFEDFSNFGEVFLWDLDKTYLDTSWGSLKELWRTAIEKAFQKRNVPGTGALVSALKKAWTVDRGRSHFPLFFITASPPQMEKRIQEKWDIDSILPLGAFFKDNLKNLRPKRFSLLTNQVGFKLQALLQLRVMLSPEVKLIMWGDDSEADAIIYSLFSDICSRKISPSDLHSVLSELRVSGEQQEVLLELQSRVPAQDPVDRIYINLATDTDAEYYLKFGRRVLPTINTFQAALDLFQDQRINIEQLCQVGFDMRANFNFSQDELTLALDDLIRRKVLSAETLEKIQGQLKSNHLILHDYEPRLSPIKRSCSPSQREEDLEGQFEPWVPEKIEYFRDYR